MTNDLDRITDEMACKIANYAVGYEDKYQIDHEVVDRIYGICVGIMGRHNDMHTIEITENNGIVDVTNNDTRFYPRFPVVNNKKIIRKTISDIGYSLTTFNGSPCQ